jgi:hypothetical protein
MRVSRCVDAGLAEGQDGLGDGVVVGVGFVEFDE